jgi:glycosyltransferase involved in cell wall biosynthesis
VNILHYSLGFPPFRTGGLTKYCMDLMTGQKELGNSVGMLWPGRFGLINRATEIRRRKPINGILSYEIINPLPVPLDEGIKDINSYTAKCDKKIFLDFFINIKPDAIHVHTLMGLHKEFLAAAKELSIKIVYTTHDFFGICPKVTLFRNGHTCEDDDSCRHCMDCNKSALSLKKIQLMQSPFYRFIKNYKLVEYFRKKHRSQFFSDSLKTEKKNVLKVKQNGSNYLSLRKYYVSILEMIDTFHFNSSITEKVYEKYVSIKDAKMINITHKDIKDHRVRKEFIGKLKLTYLSPAKPYKGYYVMKRALDELFAEGYQNFELNVYSIPDEISPYMNIKGNYKYSDLKDIFAMTDILLAPSICYETFGYTVLEALSYGVPVIVSENVGAKDLVNGNNYGFVIKANLDEMKDCILDLILNKKTLYNYNESILSSFDLINFYRFVELVNKLYQ